MNPYLALSVAPITLAPIDLTAATGGVGNDETMKGCDGSAWTICSDNRTGLAPYRKATGGEQLVMSFFADGGATMPDYGGGFTQYTNPAYCVAKDMFVPGSTVSAADEPDGNTGFNIARGVNIHATNTGLRLNAFAGRDRRQMVYVFDNGQGSFLVTATLPGLAPQTYVLAAQTGPTRVTVSYSAPAWGAQLQLELRCTATVPFGSEQFAFVQPLYAYIGVPIRPAAPAGPAALLARRYGRY